MRLAGKITKVSPLRYTPNGRPLLEVIVAVTQRFLGEETVGYFEVIYSESETPDMVSQLKIGRSVAVEGTLWSRRYRDRSGKMVTEKKVIAQKFLEKEIEETT